MTEQEHTPPKDQSQFPSVGEQLFTKLDGISKTAMGHLDLFTQQLEQEELNKALYPSKMNVLQISYSMAFKSVTIREVAKKTGLLREDLRNRTERIYQFILDLHPTLADIQALPESIQDFYTRTDVVQDLRLTHFLTDQMVTKVWLSLPDDQFAQFLTALQQRQLPVCLTSDQEMVRLHADI